MTKQLELSGVCIVFCFFVLPLKNRFFMLGKRLMQEKCIPLARGFLPSRQELFSLSFREEPNFHFFHLWSESMQNNDVSGGGFRGTCLRGKQVASAPAHEVDELS